MLHRDELREYYADQRERPGRRVGVQWELLALTPAHTTEPWRTPTAATPGR